MNLVTHPNKVLVTKCAPILVVGKDDPNSSVFSDDVILEEDISELVAFMRKTMDETDAVGLAANQVGVLKRVFLMRRFYMLKDGLGKGNLPKFRFEPRDETHVMVNPVILERSKELMVFIEGCLSFPNKIVQTRRPGAVKVVYYTEHGKMVCEVLDGLESIIFQHELDHLNGKDFRDREFAGRR